MITDTFSAKISHDGHIFVSAGLKVTYTCEMNLQVYPMDIKMCNISFNALELNPIWNDQRVEYDKKSIKVSGFTVNKITCDFYNASYSIGEWRGLGISFHLNRTFPPLSLLLIKHHPNNSYFLPHPSSTNRLASCRAPPFYNTYVLSTQK